MMSMMPEGTVYSNDFQLGSRLLVAVVCHKAYVAVLDLVSFPTHTRTHACAHTHVHTYAYKPIHKAHERMHAHTHSGMDTRTHTNTHAHMNAHIPKHICMRERWHTQTLAQHTNHMRLQHD